MLPVHTVRISRISRIGCFSYSANLAKGDIPDIRQHTTHSGHGRTTHNVSNLETDAMPSISTATAWELRQLYLGSLGHVNSTRPVSTRGGPFGQAPHASLAAQQRALFALRLTMTGDANVPHNGGPSVSGFVMTPAQRVQIYG